MLFVSDHNVVRAADSVTVWFRNEYFKSQTSGPLTSYRSSVSRYQLSCTRSAMRVLAYSYYTKSNLDGTFQSFVNDEDKVRWEPAVPGTIGELMVNWACSKAKHKQ